MKKFLSLMISIVCILGLVACSNGNAKVESSTTKSDLAAAKEYLYTMYKDQNAVTPTDYSVVGLVNIGGVKFDVTWTADSDTIKIVPEDKMVTIDVDEKNPEEVNYKLTATLADTEGKTESVTFERSVPAAIIIEEGMSYEEIVEAAYQLQDGIAMEGEYRLFGTITKIDTPYSADYKNITVTIQVGNLADKPMMCYRLAGEGADKLAVGDQITVEGAIKNYKGTIEFDAGCQLVGMGEVKDQSAMLEAAYALAEGIAMTDSMTLTGVISKVDTAYSAEYKNVTVTMICDGIEDKPIMCYRLKGEGADTIAVGDTITVTGIMKNYKGTIEFDAGCTLDAFTKAEGAATEEPVAEAKPAFDSAILFDEAQLVAAAYALADGESIPTPAVLKGAITEIGTPYSAEYKNVTVTIKAADKDIVCFRLKGEGADKLAVGDEIAVVGTLKNYQGTIEFDAGCQLVPAEEEENAAVAVAAYALVNCETEIADEKTVTGVITSVDTAYSAEYKNVTVTIQVADLADYAIQCFRLSGEGADTIKEGDTITVKGNLSTYDGKVQIAKGTLVK